MGAIISNVINWLKNIAASPDHGYSQSNRWGNPDYDCSSLIISAFEQAGVGVKSRGATYTGNMRPVFLACGFKDVTQSVNLLTGAGLLPGDVLLNITHHTALYLGDGALVQASQDEKGGISGGQPGDQTGVEINVHRYYNFPWDCVLRYEESDPQPTPAPIPVGTYTVKDGDSLWGIAERFLGSGLKYPEIMAANGLKSSLIYVGQVLRIPGAGDKKTISITITAATYEALQMTAESEHISIGEVIDGFFIQDN